MFKRREKKEWLQQTREYFWPQSGWNRSGLYLFHRLGRLPGSSYTIAAGFACGAAVSCTPFIGLHFVLAAILAWTIRGNILTSAIGTAVGNPWTFPFIWIWTYNLGNWMTFDDAAGTAKEIDFAGLFAGMTHAVLEGNTTHLLETVMPIFWPMFLGSLPTAAVVWGLFYFSLKPLVRTYQIRRLVRIQKNKLKRDAAATGTPPLEG